MEYREPVDHTEYLHVRLHPCALSTDYFREFPLFFAHFIYDVTSSRKSVIPDLILLVNDEKINICLYYIHNTIFFFFFCYRFFHLFDRSICFISDFSVVYYRIFFVGVRCLCYTQLMSTSYTNTE
jgi:hypothetical protein